jgi:nitroreductase
MIDYTKQCAAKLGWNGAKEDKDRRFLSNLKDALTAWDDSPFLTTCAMAHMAIKEGCEIVFIDAREPDDIDRLKQAFSCLTVLVKRGGQKDYGNHMADTAIAIENMMIEANELNLGSCYINQLNWLNEDPALKKYMQTLGMKDTERVYGAVILGYPETENQLPNRTPLERKGNEVTYIL